MGELNAAAFWWGYTLVIATGVCLGMIWAWLIRGFVRMLAEGLTQIRQGAAALFKRR